EVAHTFGLDHQSTDGSSLNTCMDYFSNTGANATSTRSTRPNAHDFEELKIIYSHLDSSTTGDVTDEPETCGQLVSQSENGRSSKYEKIHGDGSMTVTQVYWTLEAAEKCPSCDHRNVR